MKRAFGLIVAFLVCAVLCGCDFSIKSADSLMRAPELPGDYALLQKAFAASVDTSFKLKNPVSGDHHSAFVLHDLDGDGNEEALVFYTREDSSTVYVTLMRRQADGSWIDSGVAESPGTDVNSVRFADIGGDAAEEIIVTWSVTDIPANKYLCVYGSGPDGNIFTMATELYDMLYVTDVNGDGVSEVFIALRDTVDDEPLNYFKLLGYSAEYGLVSKISDVSVAPAAESFLAVASDTKGGSVRLFVDESTGNNIYQTEIICWDDGSKRLYIPKTVSDRPLSSFTQRNVKTLCEDIDGDGMIEIPSVVRLPGATRYDPENGVTENLYLNVWYAAEDDKLTDFKRYIDCSGSGYTFDFPESWMNLYTVQYDISKGSLEFYLYNDEDSTRGGLLFSLERETVSDAVDDDDDLDRYPVYSGNEYNYFAIITPAALEQGITAEEIIGHFAPDSDG